MENLTVEECLKKYPYLKKMTKNTHFIEHDDFIALKNSDYIEVMNQKISIKFLENILRDDTYYHYACRFLSNEISIFNVTYIISGDTGGAISYTKSQIVVGIEKLINDGLIKLNDQETERFNYLKSLISYKNFLQIYENEIFSISMDGKEYQIPVKQIINLMTLSKEEFDELCDNNDIKDFCGIPKKYFIYASYKFFKNNNIFENFVLPEKMFKRYNDIRSLQKIDIQAINNFFETEDELFKKVEIDKELENKILEGLPNDANELEKAIYIYIKMCKLLTYDDEYYAVNQIGEATYKHQDIKYVSSINLKNNKIVCFEFNLIYSKLLDKLGIKFRSTYKNMIGEAYGGSHAYLEFRSQKFLVKADSVMSILLGDIMQAKLNQPLFGLICLNKNEKTKKEFYETVNKVYELIAEQEKSNERYMVGHIKTLDELLAEYKQVTSNLEDIDINERFAILIEKVNETKMVGIDSLSYVLQLRSIMFNEYERQNNMFVTIIRNNEPFDKERVAMASAIFTINVNGIETNPEENIYYYFNPNKKLIVISKEELQDKFDNKIFEYVQSKNPKIPGIIERGGLKK